MNHQPRRARGLPSDGPDYGPLLVRSERGVRVLEGAISVELEDRADPERPAHTVRGARRTDGLLVVLGVNGTQRRTWPDEARRRYDAAERLRDDTEAATGARQTGDNAGVRTGWVPGGYGISDAVLEAQGRVGAAWRVLGPIGAGVVTEVVLGRGSLDAFARSRGVGYARAKGWLVEALDRLVGHYEGVGR